MEYGLIFGEKQPIQTTTFVFVNGQSTTTVDVCSPTAK
jgi:hypothetical protein